MSCRVLGPLALLYAALSVSNATVLFALQEEVSFPVEFEDSQSRPVRIERPPGRIVSLNPGNSEILMSLQARELIAGADRYSLETLGESEIDNVGTLLAPQFERIVALKPDLVLITELSANHRDKLENLGLTVAMLDPYRLEPLYETIGRLARIAGRAQRGRELVAQLRRRVDRVSRASARIPASDRPRVFVEIWPDPLRSAGSATFFHELIETAGGRNIASDAVSQWPLFSLEKLVERDPQVILTPSPESLEQMRSGHRPRWNGLSALRNGQVYLVDRNSFSRPGPRLIDELERLSRILQELSQ